MLCALSLLAVRCNSQEPQVKETEQLLNRQPVFAGQFYPADKAELTAVVGSFFQEAGSEPATGLCALIVPHAGYVYSGRVAAKGYKKVDPNQRFDRIFILASSHRTYFEGASVYTEGNYLTPMGEVPVDLELARSLTEQSDLFDYHPDAHANEHSIEVQLPFIQYRLKHDFRIIPVVLGTQSSKVCRDIASVLEPYFVPENLFIISSDFSHYPSHEAATELDREAANAILSNDPQKFAGIISEKRNLNVPDLATRCCGWSAVLTLMYMTQHKDLDFELVGYMNSGDVKGGDKTRVVGYNAIAVKRKGAEEDRSFILDEKAKGVLLGLARSTIEEYIATRSLPELRPEQFPESLHRKCGAFVTLHKHGRLRGCIGRFSAEEPLYEVVQSMAVAAATQDTRFMPVAAEELGELEVEISVLTPMKPVASIDEIELGKHGIYIKKGMRSGTFLPQVASETGWSLEEFLGHCARDKAGIGWEGWKDAEIYTYEALVFSESN